MTRRAAVLLLLSCCLFAAPAHADRAGEAAIRKLFAELCAAWDAHDATRLAALWAVNGDAIEADGMVAKRRPEIEKLYATEHAGALRDSRLTLHVDEIWFVRPDVALVDGRFTVTNARDANDQGLPPRSGLLSALVHRERGAWRILATRSMIPQPVPWRP